MADSSFIPVPFVRAARGFYHTPSIYHPKLGRAKYNIIAVRSTTSSFREDSLFYGSPSTHFFLASEAAWLFFSSVSPLSRACADLRIS